jgi:hypothetical protein
MSQIALFLYVALGVAVSVLLPLLRPLLPKPNPIDGRGGGGDVSGNSRWKTFINNASVKMSIIWHISKPFVVLGIFSLVVALVIFAFLGDTLKTWQSAFLVGYMADSTLQKLVTNRQDYTIAG